MELLNLRVGVFVIVLGMVRFPYSETNTSKEGQVGQASPLGLHVAPPFALKATGSEGRGALLTGPSFLSGLCLAPSRFLKGDVFASLITCPLYWAGSRGSEWGRNLLTETQAPGAVVPELVFLSCCSFQLSGLALFAETVWVTADQYRVYPLMGVSGKDDVFAGAWIAIFCGFSFFVVASFGVGAALCRRRSMILTVRPQEEGMGTRRHKDHPHRFTITTTTAATLVCSSWHYTQASW